MKTVLIFLAIFGLCGNLTAQTWDEWVKQKKTQRKYLLQQIVKLQIYLGYIKDGYKIAREGLGTIESIKDGDFSLHNEFFANKRKIKSPVRKYSKADEIYQVSRYIREQIRKLQSLYSRPGSLFTKPEQSYFENKQNQLLLELSDDMESLDETINLSNLELSDSERISRIEEIWRSVDDKKDWIQRFKNSIYLLNVQRQKLLIENEITRELYGL